MNIISSVILSALIASASFAFTPKSDAKSTADQIKISIPSDSYGLQGCCSWHGGVSHCSYGSVVCNDGSYSPSCRCR
jgi:hypothetical protein